MSIFKDILNTGKKLLGVEKVGMEQVADQNQQELINMLMARAKGQNSLAEAQTKSGLQQNLSNQMTGIRGMGGVNSGLRQRMMQNASSKTGGQIVNQGAQARMQEANEAQGLLGNILQGRAGLQADMAEKTKERRGAMIRAIGQGASSAMTGGAGGMM